MYRIELSGKVISEEINTLIDSTGSAKNNFNWDNILPRSLAYIIVRNEEGKLIGFCNLSWDGGRHAIFYDLNIHPDYHHKDLPTKIILPLMTAAKEAGVKYLHAGFMKSRLNLAKSYGFQEVHAVLKIFET